MKICITNLEVGSITNIGSLNIGKTILSQNRASSSSAVISPPEQPEQQQLLTAPTPGYQPVLPEQAGYHGQAQVTPGSISPAITGEIGIPGAPAAVSPQGVSGISTGEV